MTSFPLQRLLARLWWGPARRPFEAIARRTVGTREKVLSGPLRNVWFDGGLAQKLGVYEIRVQQALGALLGVGDRFFDIGAHSGFFALLGSRLVGDGGVVVACEPNPPILPLLRSNIERNHASNVHIVEAAVASQPGRIAFVSEFSRPTTEAHLSDEDSDSTLTVEGVTLDSLVQMHGVPSVVKIDVEGHAGAVLRGGRSLLQCEGGPAFLIEVHSGTEERSCRTMFEGRTIVPLKPCREGRTEFPRHIVAHTTDGSRTSN